MLLMRTKLQKTKLKKKKKPKLFSEIFSWTTYKMIISDIFFSKILMIDYMDNGSKLFPYELYSGFTLLKKCNSRSRSVRYHLVYILLDTETKCKRLSTKYEIRFWREEANKRTWRYQMQNKSAIEESANQLWNGMYITALL